MKPLSETTTSGRSAAMASRSVRACAGMVSRKTCSRSKRSRSGPGGNAARSGQMSSIRDMSMSAPDASGRKRAPVRSTAGWRYVAAATTASSPRSIVMRARARIGLRWPAAGVAANRIFIWLSEVTSARGEPRIEGSWCGGRASGTPGPTGFASACRRSRPPRARRGRSGGVGQIDAVAGPGPVRSVMRRSRVCGPGQQLPRRCRRCDGGGRRDQSSRARRRSGRPGARRYSCRGSTGAAPSRRRARKSRVRRATSSVASSSAKWPASSTCTSASGTSRL